MRKWAFLMKDKTGNLLTPFLIVLVVALFVSWVIAWVISIIAPQLQYFYLPIFLVILFIFTMLLMKTW